MAMIDERLIDRIRALHDGPERGYHGWSHPQTLLALHAEVAEQFHDPLAVYCAILLHDVIYEPRATDNETRSAMLAAELLAGEVSEATLDRIVRLIEVTAAHAIPPGLSDGEAADMALFLDMDLSILGAPAAAFDAYEAGVRHEYREVPDATFRDGRAKILERFLARDRLFLSDWGYIRFEGTARANLARSIAALREH